MLDVAWFWFKRFLLFDRVGTPREVGEQLQKWSEEAIPCLVFLFCWHAPYTVYGGRTLSELLLVFSPEEVKQAGPRGHKHKVGLHPRLSSGFSQKIITNLSLRAEVTKVPGSLEWGQWVGVDIQSKAVLWNSESPVWPFSFLGILTTNSLAAHPFMCARTKTFLEQMVLLPNTPPMC